MLALVTIVAGSVITGYSAYKIHVLRRGRGRKLREMEILRRLDIPPKKQVRVWSFLMVLGLVLLTPGLGYLLSIDPISGSGGEAPYSNLRASPSSSPTMVPPSEKLDNTPRTLNDEGFSRIFFASSGGGSSRRSSSGGSKTTSPSSSSETATRVEGSSGGGDSTAHVSLLNDDAKVSGAGLASSGPEIDTASETTTKASVAKSEDRRSKTEPKPTESSTESAKIDKAPEKTSAQGAPELSEISGETKPTPTRSAIFESELEKKATSSTLGYSAAETVPKSNPFETLTESVTIDVEPEKNTAPDITGDSAVKTVPESNSSATFPAHNRRIGGRKEYGSRDIRIFGDRRRARFDLVHHFSTKFGLRSWVGPADDQSRIRGLRPHRRTRSVPAHSDDRRSGDEQHFRSACHPGREDGAADRRS